MDVPWAVLARLGDPNLDGLAAALQDKIVEALNAGKTVLIRRPESADAAGKHPFIVLYPDFIQQRYRIAQETDPATGKKSVKDRDAWISAIQNELEKVGEEMSDVVQAISPGDEEADVGVGTDNPYGVTSSPKLDYDTLRKIIVQQDRGTLERMLRPEFANLKPEEKNAIINKFIKLANPGHGSIGAWQQERQRIRQSRPTLSKEKVETIALARVYDRMRRGHQWAEFVQPVEGWQNSQTQAQAPAQAQAQAQTSRPAIMSDLEAHIADAAMDAGVNDPDRYSTAAVDSLLSDKFDLQYRDLVREGIRRLVMEDINSSDSGGFKAALESLMLAMDRMKSTKDISPAQRGFLASVALAELFLKGKDPKQMAPLQRTKALTDIVSQLIKTGEGERAQKFAPIAPSATQQAAPTPAAAAPEVAQAPAAAATGNKPIIRKRGQKQQVTPTAPTVTTPVAATPAPAVPAAIVAAAPVAATPAPAVPAASTPLSADNFDEIFNKGHENRFAPEPVEPAMSGAEDEWDDMEQRAAKDRRDELPGVSDAPEEFDDAVPQAGVDKLAGEPRSAENKRARTLGQGAVPREPKPAPPKKYDVRQDPDYPSKSKTISNVLTTINTEKQHGLKRSWSAQDIQSKTDRILNIMHTQQVPFAVALTREMIRDEANSKRAKVWTDARDSWLKKFKNRAQQQIQAGEPQGWDNDATLQQVAEYATYRQMLRNKNAPAKSPGEIQGEAEETFRSQGKIQESEQQA